MADVEVGRGYGGSAAEPQDPLRFALPYVPLAPGAQPAPSAPSNRCTATLMCEVRGVVLFGRKCEN